MKSFLPLLSLSLLFTSCTTAYKSGHTPDDVYFSPERPQAEYVRAEKRDDRQYREEERTYNNERLRNDYYSYDDSYLRMKVRNRQRWNYLDNEYYSYNPYSYRYNNSYYSYNSPWSNYSYWNHYYNPYAPQIIVVNPKSPAYNRPRTTNLRVFNDPQPANNNPKVTGINNGNNTNSRSNSAGSTNRSPRRDFGNDLRNIFGTEGSSTTTYPSSSNNSSSNNSSSRTSTSTPSSSSSSSGSSSSGSSGGNAPARRF